MNRTPLYDEHLRWGGKVVDFNGWALPVQFSGIVSEHVHTRTKVSLFDCSHMGEYRVLGADSIERFSREVMSDIAAIPVGRCRYGAILNEAGGIVDDIITFRMGPEELYVVTNAGPLEHVTRRLQQGNPGVEHVSYETAKIDVQGPLSRERVLAAGLSPARDLKYFNAVWTEWRGSRVLLSRTGYTGELGYEIFLPNELAVELWKVFLAMDDVLPAGLGARDTLRTEVGYNLSGQDFNESVSPLEASMEPFIAWDREFVGAEAVRVRRESGDWRVQAAVASLDRRAPRHDFEVYDGDRAVGVVTSGTFGPSVGHGIGLARVDKRCSKIGTTLVAGAKRLPLTVVQTPFYKNGTCRVKAG